MKNKIFKNNKGFIALISAIIISAVLTGFLFTISRASFYARFDVLDREYKYVATTIAESCINHALLELAKNYLYDPDNEHINVGDGSCYVVSTTPHNPRKSNSEVITILTKGAYKNAFSNFQVVATVYNPNTIEINIPTPPHIAIDSWNEIDTTGP